ncbi:MAG: ABC transporter ATP-binding protein [Methanomassiliicoccus sp.]|nr:ABC transporter ATP-binding protein [Methanomassiliicoccus sp.]
MAADDLDLTVNNGEYLCLLGPTGAGKTTALRIIAGLTKPDSGQVLFDDRDITRLEPEERNAVLLSQTYSLFPTMTVAENILFGPSIRKMPEEEKKQTLVELLDLVRLTKRADSYPRELSGGMQQRNALARALATSPDVLLLDEPLRALDARLRIDLRYELRSMAKSLGLTVIHVTHDQEEAMVMADRIAVIRDGRIVQIGTPREVFDSPATPFVANFVGQSNFFTGSILCSGHGRTTTVHDEEGRIVFARPCTLPVDSKVVVAIKIGNTRVVKKSDAFLTGTVERTLFEGRIVHLDVGIPGLERFSVKLPASRRDQVTVGDEIGLNWGVQKASVFPYPEGGLDNELRVD